jgi:hypothetical protein
MTLRSARRRNSEEQPRSAADVVVTAANTIEGLALAAIGLRAQRLQVLLA